MTRLVHYLRAGRLTYQAGLDLQAAIKVQQLNDSHKNVLILTEHDPPVYTIGIRTKNYSHIDEQHLRSLGAQFFRTNRGGLITFHGPGQLVAYPILNLKHFTSSLRWYICQIEATIIDLCRRHFELPAQRTSDTGIWIGDRKICAIGVHCSRYITTHGMALNCEPDLEWFEHIVPCGIENKGVTSLSAELNRSVTVDDVQAKFLECFRENFECELMEIDAKERTLIFDELNLHKN